MAVNFSWIKAPSGILKLIALFLCVVCVILFHAEVHGESQITRIKDVHHFWLAIIASGGYCIILGALILTYILGEGCHLKLEGVFLTVGTILFLALGIVSLIFYDKSTSGSVRSRGLAFGSMALINGLVMLVDTLLTGKAIKGK